MGCWYRSRHSYRSSIPTYSQCSWCSGQFSIANSLKLTKSCSLSEKPLDERFEVPVDEVYDLCDELHAETVKHDKDRLLTTNYNQVNQD